MAAPRRTRRAELGTWDPRTRTVRRLAIEELPYLGDPGALVEAAAGLLPEGRARRLDLDWGAPGLADPREPCLRLAYRMSDEGASSTVTVTLQAPDLVECLWWLMRHHRDAITFGYLTCSLPAR